MEDEFVVVVFIFLRSAGFRRSPSTKVRFGLLSQCLMFCRVPLLRLSKTQTWAPCVMMASTRWLPMKPAPAVTNVFSVALVFVLMNRFL